ncbi:MAG: hypothetical protein QM692_23750 [Thermomicrobiales bacterium]
MTELLTTERETILVQGEDSTLLETRQVQVLLTEGVQGPPGPPGPAGSGTAISADADNRATLGSDGGVYVSDDFAPDPLAYYILAKA